MAAETETKPGLHLKTEAEIEIKLGLQLLPVTTNRIVLVAVWRTALDFVRSLKIYVHQELHKFYFVLTSYRSF